MKNQEGEELQREINQGRERWRCVRKPCGRRRDETEAGE